MMEIEFTWFFRFTIKKNGHVVEMSELIDASGPNKAWNKLINDLTSRHGITRTDIDILVMNKV